MKLILLVSFFLSAAGNFRQFDNFLNNFGQKTREISGQKYSVAAPTLQENRVSNVDIKGIALLAVKSFASFGLVGLIVKSGFNIVKKFMAKGLKNRNDAIESRKLSDLLKNLNFKDNSGSVQTAFDVYSTNSSYYTALIFDCDKELNAPGDAKAREDYFVLLSNLTYRVSNIMKTIYVPGNGNPHIIESNSKFSPDWLYFGHSKTGDK